jgi:hypothetical protein
MALEIGGGIVLKLILDRASFGLQAGLGYYCPKDWIASELKALRKLLLHMKRKKKCGARLWHLVCTELKLSS